MFRSTFLVIILAIFGFGIIFGLIGGVVGSMVEKQQSLETVESSSEADRVQEDAMEEEETQKTPQEIAAIKNLCGSRSDDCFSCDITLGNVFRF